MIFIIPGAGDPSLQLDFDPQLQIIHEDQAIVFVNADFVRHQLVVRTADDRQQQIFATGVLENNQFVSYTFTENGKYSLECKLFLHMKGEIIVTDDIAIFTKSVPVYNLDVQLTRSPANPDVGQETYFKVIFIEQTTGRNHPHVDYTLNFNDSQGNYVDGMGGHTVAGAAFGSFRFDNEDAFTPVVTVSGLNLPPVSPEAVRIDTVVTPEFTALGAGAVMGVAGIAIGAVTLSRKLHI